MARWDFWTHGVATVVEFPERVTLERHAGWGTLIRQAAGRGENNWFHLPLATPTALESDTEVAVVNIVIQASVNENARIREIHVRQGGQLFYSAAVNLPGPEIEHSETIGAEYSAWASGLATREVNRGLTVCVRVEFLSGAPEGQIVFRGVGAHFDE